jgi:hypothetical protein
MTEKQSYLYSSPEGVIKLIEGDKMPVKPVKPPDEIPTHAGTLCIGGDVFGYEKAMKKYEAALQAAKEQAVTVADQEKAKRIIMQWLNDQPLGQGMIEPERIYGPFSLRYEIESKCGKFGFNTVICGKCFSDGNGCQEPVKVAILYDDTPEKEPDFEVWASEYAESFKTGEWFENIRKEAYLHALQRLWKLTITRK